MFTEWQKVKLKNSGEVGMIIDISVIAGNHRYVVEGSVPEPDGTWPLFDCAEDELEPTE